MINVTETPQEPEFPVLMERIDGGQNRVVLFTSPTEGTVVYNPVNPETVGWHNDAWDLSEYKLYTGTLLLVNA